MHCNILQSNIKLSHPKLHSDTQKKLPCLFTDRAFLLIFTIYGKILQRYYHNGRRLCPLSCRMAEKGGIDMITYDNLFQFGMLIVSIIGLVYTITQKK